MRFPPIILSALFVSLNFASGGVLYETDFENFTDGDNMIPSKDGWTATDSTNGVQGISDFDISLGKSAWIGYGDPATTTVAVGRSYNYDPVAAGTPVIDFFTYVGIADSTNNRRDRFYISFFNSANDLLASIEFDNTDTGTAGVDIFTSDGLNSTDASITVPFDVLLEVSAKINYQTNRWTVFINDDLIVNDGIFTSTGRARNLGSIDVEWEQATPPQQGNNFMLFDLWELTYPEPLPLVVTGFSRASGGAATIQWQGEPGMLYQIEHSTNLTNWLTNLPNSVRTTTTKQTLSFTDSTAASAADRHYRIRRTVAP